jgi:signal transduction histidine kinase
VTVRSRLFIKIYLTVVAGLLAVALASGAFWRLASDREETGWAARRDQFIAAMLPASDGAAATQATLERLAGAFDADISVYAPSGELIASVGEPLPLPPDGRRRDRDRMHAFVARLDDGRRVVGRLEPPFDRPGGRQLVYLLLIAAVIGLAAYPVVRNLTRRLERLRQGVETFGKGDLVARVPVEGRDEVAGVAASFNAAADRIEKLVTAHRALLANASHELRSPLARLRMASELDAEAPSAARRAEMAENLAELDQLVEEILLASRLDHVGLPKDLQPVDLLAVAAQEAARNGLAADGVAAVVRGDERLLARMVRNLMANALRHGAPPVEIKVESRAGHACLSVRDHGSGIPDEEKDRVFEPFYRPAGRAETSGGWGLGLALVRQIAELHGARVSLETPADGGTRFTVEFME